MTDIALTLTQNSSELFFDIAMQGPDLLSGKDLETAVYLSLFTNRRANPEDLIDSNDRGGWWGDTYLPMLGDKFGSRLWLLCRSKQTQHVVNLAKAYTLEALQWLLDDKVAQAVEVETEIVRKGVLGIGISIKKPNGETQQFYYDYVWDQLNAI